MTAGPRSNEEDVPCISPANCLIQYLHHVVHKSHAPTTEVEEEAMKRARAQHGGSLYLNQIADCTGKPLEGSWRCFASHMLSEAEASDLPWSPKELERLREACEECDVGDWMMVASRLGNTCPEECEAQWRRLQTADGEAPTTTRADNVGGAEEKGGSCGLLQSAGSEDVKRVDEENHDINRRAIGANPCWKRIAKLLFRLTPQHLLTEGADVEVPVFYWPEHPEGQGRLQGVPLKRLILNMNRTPYELRGWCQAEAQWSSMRCSSARLVLLDGLPSLPDEAGKAPMTPETFQTLGARQRPAMHAPSGAGTKMEKRSKFLAKSLALLPLLPQAPFLAAELSSAGGAPPDLFVYATAPAALAAALLLEVFFVLCTGGCRSCRCATLDFLTFLLSSTVNALVFLLSFGSLGFATLHNATEILPGCQASLTCQALIFGHVLSAVVLLAWICTLRCLCVLWASSLGPCFHSKDPALMATL
eukprot:g24164.t1